jgi:CelD/BcsL family acetyltransferase involved in cellulose biosynthesis
MQPYEWANAESPYLDLRGGFDRYRQERKERGSGLLEEMARKARKLEREVGPIRFEFHTRDEGVFARLLEWKAAQREQTKTFNVLNMGWARDLLKRIQATQTDDFAGMLSALYAGDQLAAVHLGMRSRSALHYWIPTYNPALGKYSPGSMILLETARAASEIGVTRLDMGAGDERYKNRFKSGFLMLGFGSVNCSLTSTLLSGIRYASHRCSRSSPLYDRIASIKSALQRVYYGTFVRSNRLKRSEV